MAERPAPDQLTRDVKAQLDGVVVGIELTLISIIQGMVLQVLAASAVDPFLELQFEYWPYIITGLVAILIFWSRALIHTLSFISWPLEFGHNFVYFASTLVEAVALTQVTNPRNFFAMSAITFGMMWFLYWYDLRVVYRHEHDFQTPSERKLYEDICADQLMNTRVFMPLGVFFSIIAWYLVSTQPELMLDNKGHVVIGVATIFASILYLWDGVRIFARRQRWIVARQVQERREAFEPSEIELA
jgi:hypothetical protein